MKIYFLSAQPCALTLNGLYYGITDRFERFAEISPKDRIFAQFIPEGRQPVGFFITEELRFTPPKGCEVYLLRDGVAVYAKEFPPSDFTMRVIAQERFENVLATVFSQGALQLSVQSEQGFFTAKLPDEWENCTLSCHDGFLFLRSDDVLAVYNQKAEPLLCEKTADYTYENGVLSAVLPLSDSLSRVADCEWLLQDGRSSQIKFTLRQAPRENCSEPEKIAAELLPYAFLESVLIGANFEDMLCDELIDGKEKIRAFLGDFQAVTLTDDPCVCGLVKQKGERLFEVEYVTVLQENGKITDIRA